MKKILMILSLFLVVGCASTDTSKKDETVSPIGAVSKALEKVVIPKF